MGARMQYDFQTEDLIVKLIIGAEHALPHTNFMRAVDAKLTAMGLDRLALASTASITLMGNMRCWV